MGEKMAQSDNQPVGFHFINMIHPADATNPSSISQIRSHVAKDIRARRRRACLAKSQSNGGSQNQVHHHDRVEAATVSRVEHKKVTCSQGFPDVEKMKNPRSRSIQPMALQIPQLCNKDPNFRPVRPISPMEVFLLEHYVDHVVLFRNGSCYKAGNNKGCREVVSNTKAWFTSMQLKCWLPFALADLGLLSTLLLHSCHSLDMLSGVQSYYELYTVYKHQCIRLTNDSLSLQDTRISDATIALVMVLVSDSYNVGNIEEWNIHLCACTNMIMMRGGIDALGLDGFLKEVIQKSPLIYGDWSS